MVPLLGLTAYEHWLFLSIEDEFGKDLSTLDTIMEKCRVLDVKFEGMAILASVQHIGT